MATIKAIEARSIHQIQSGQVIVDLCSVVKELIENSLDAGASSLEVRFKNNGLGAIEVQDNGSGVSHENYETIALKHYTSKLSSYDDLSSLQTFGFRGEALSSLCALSNFHIVTARADEAPKATRLDFETSGKLAKTTVIAGQKGTTAVMEDLFQNLPVRRRELEKNIKREYLKVLGLLQAYACISVDVKFTVKSLMPKGKNTTAFATKANRTTKENILNVYGAKTVSALAPLDLKLYSQSSVASQQHTHAGDNSANKVYVSGHISRPVFGEGRQTPDRQMFFVNSRPCGLPQIAKAINEVYRSFNVSQSPFIFADFQIDTNAYDVNVSPDKRTIMLHDAAVMIESLKMSLMEMFENQDQTVPQSQLQTQKLPAFKQLTIPREASTNSLASAASAPSSENLKEVDELAEQSDAENSEPTGPVQAATLLHDFFRHNASTREDPKVKSARTAASSDTKQRLLKAVGKAKESTNEVDEYDDARQIREADDIARGDKPVDLHVRDFNARMAEQQRNNSSAQDDHSSPSSPGAEQEESIPRAHVEKIPEPQPSVVQNAFDRMRPKRVSEELATITIGDKTVTTVIGHQPPAKKLKVADDTGPKYTRKKSIKSSFGQSLRTFSAPGTQIESEEASGSDDEEHVDEGPQPFRRSSAGDHQESEQEEEDEDQSEAQDEDSSAMPAEKANLDEHHTNKVNEAISEESAVSANDEDNDDPEAEQDAFDQDGSGDEYIDEAEKKAREEAKVAELIRVAEEKAALPSQANIKRAATALKGGHHKDATTSLQLSIDGSLARVEEQLTLLQENLAVYTSTGPAIKDENGENGAVEPKSEEERLSLTVSKQDFAHMRIAGQFNLGFILATRPSATSDKDSNDQSTVSPACDDEVFIIDQHASDEKYNFERLQSSTTVGNQRLVQPRRLSLTALEEEVILENLPVLEKNGFLVDVDDSGAEAVGNRCRLTSLPLSKEVVFDTRDLEELVGLLAESPTSVDGGFVPRPSKVRKMFAMRACRSSVMVGKTLSVKQMETIVRHMGEIDKPWNCPHGRPTMRHLMSLGRWEGWMEGDGVVGMGVEEEEEDGLDHDSVTMWEKYLSQHDT